MSMSKCLTLVCTLAAGLWGGQVVIGSQPENWDGKIVQYGKMREAIGQQQHEPRVRLETLIERPHFYCVAALAGLAGEATILDGQVMVTRANSQGQLEPRDFKASDGAATLLVGAYIPSWIDHKTMTAVKPDEFDNYILEQATQAGLKSSEPFVFIVEGEFESVHLHVINGACPLHARLRNVQLPPDKQPFEIDFKTIQGTLVGVFAKDAVGNITHPATTTHVHLVYRDDTSGKQLTGHVERVGVMAGAMLRLPCVSER